MIVLYAIYAQDTHTDGAGLLSVDHHQDYVLDLVHVTSAGSLVVEFHRLYDTCDTDDYLIDVSIIRYCNSLVCSDR